MSLCSRRWILLVLPAAAAGCGFKPVHGTGGAAEGLRNRVSLAEARSPTDFAYRERVRRRIGDAGAAADWTLVYDVSLQETGAAIEQDLDVTRFNIIGTAVFTLDSVSSEPSFGPETITATASFDAIGDAFATRSARQAAERRLAEELAERTATRLFGMIGA